MSQHVLLNSVEHRDLRVRTGHAPGLGDDTMLALTFPDEFRNIQAHYPIVFRKGADGSDQPLALLGLQEGSNLFLQGDRWDANYVPLSVRRQPFLVGMSGEEKLIHVDMAHRRICRIDDGSGERLFHPHGGTTEFLDHVSSMLMALHDGVAATPSFIDALQRHALLEPFVLDMQLSGAHAQRFAGFRTINEDRLQALDGAVLERLSRDGHLLPIYMVLASMSRFRDLIDRANDAHAAGR